MLPKKGYSYMIDLSKIKAKRVMKFDDFKAAVGAPAEMDFDTLADAMSDYCDLDYMMLAIGGRKMESCGISGIYQNEFPGFGATAKTAIKVQADKSDDILAAIDSLVCDSGDLYFSREQIKDATGCTDDDIDEYCDEMDAEFTEELCVPTDDGKAYHVLTEDAVKNVYNITQSCIDVINSLTYKIEEVAEKGGPCAIADVLNKNMPGLIKNVNAKADAFKASEYKGQMPQLVEVL